MRNFRWQIIVRVLMIAASVVLIVALFSYSQSYVAGAMLAGATVLQIGALVRYVDRTNRELSRFLRSVRYSDFCQSFSGVGRGKSFSTLGRAFSEVMDDFRQARAETEEQHLFLQTVIQHVGTGLLSFERDGNVGLINTAAKRLFRVRHLKNVSALSDFSVEIVDVLLNMRAGEKAIVKVVHGDEMMELVLFGTRFRLRGKQFTLVSVHDIQSELEEKEIEAWQKLTRVLTHEIMNSVTPIASLASTAQEMLDEQESDDAPEERLEDIRGAVQTIERRSLGLLSFVQAYRSLTRIPRPDLKIFRIDEIFDSVVGLFKSDVEEKALTLEVSITPTGLDLTADPELTEQVLINLVKNAIQSSTGSKGAAISLSAFIGDSGRPVIQVSDNGPGIVPEALDKIFIPFFTTRKDGSGIGLSLSRQIMRQHGGTMSAFSEPGRITTFTLRF